MLVRLLVHSPDGCKAIAGADHSQTQGISWSSTWVQGPRTRLSSSTWVQGPRTGLSPSTWVQGPELGCRLPHGCRAPRTGPSSVASWLGAGSGGAARAAAHSSVELPPCVTSCAGLGPVQ